ncbi:dienelactone hydrolase, partial [Pseudomonas sp. Fl4BN2]|nr:dienelactone hydrolase [Pseudomonas sp. Fl4BN2]
MTPPIPQDDRLEDFTRRQITLDGITKTVYVTGTG